MNEVERLKLELKKAEEDLKQNEFFVTWLRGQIKIAEIKALT